MKSAVSLLSGGRAREVVRGPAGSMAAAPSRRELVGQLHDRSAGTRDLRLEPGSQYRQRGAALDSVTTAHRVGGGRPSASGRGAAAAPCRCSPEITRCVEARGLIFTTAAAAAVARRSPPLHHLGPPRRVDANRRHGIVSVGRGCRGRADGGPRPCKPEDLLHHPPASPIALGAEGATGLQLFFSISRGAGGRSRKRATRFYVLVE